MSPLDHRRIGLLHLGTALVFLCIGGILGLLLRSQLALPATALLSAASYNQLFTMHGVALIFLFAVPGVQAIGICLLPAMLGARGLPFPRLAAYAFWLYATGGSLLCATLLWSVAPDSGWALALPLASYQHSPSISVDFWIAGTAVLEVSAIAGAIQLLVAALRTRAPGMSLSRMPAYAWSVLVASAVTIVGFAPLLLADVLLAFERAFHWPFFLVGKGGDPLLWQRLFWLSSHPDAGLLFIPIAGLVSTMAPALARTRLIGPRWVVAAISAAGALSLAAWVAPLLDPMAAADAGWVQAAVNLAFAVPGGVLLGAWIATFARGRARLSVPVLWLLGAFVAFTIGGMTGLMSALPPLAGHAGNSYFAVAKLHYMLIGGLLFPLFAALYYWAPAAAGRQLSARLGGIAFALAFVGLHLGFLPMYLLGLSGMPARLYTYPAGLGWEQLNLAASGGALVLALGVGLVLLDLLLHFRLHHKVDSNPWEAPSLEWLPRDASGIRSIPTVSSSYPLWDQPGLAREVEEGAHWLPAAADGSVTQLISSARIARPQYRLKLPYRDRLGPLAAAATALAAFMIAMKLRIPATGMLLLAAAAVAVWLWRCDRPALVRSVADDDGRGTLPGDPVGPRSHSWFGVGALLVADAALFVSIGMAYFFVWFGGPGPWPPLGQPLPILTAGVGAVVLWVTSSALFAYAGPALAARSRAIAALAAAAIVHIAALAVTLYGFLSVGLAPQVHAYAALAATLLAYQTLHAVAILATIVFLSARIHAGLLDATHRITYENARLIFHYTVVQGVVAVAVLYVFPRIA
jgi:cytochrome c oxidase subunit I+III